MNTPHNAENDAGVSMSLSKGHTAEIDAACRELTCPHHGEENRRALECDHPGIAHGLGFSNFGVGRCPSCGKCKFIGHGPLCGDCYVRVTPPASTQGGAA